MIRTTRRLVLAIFLSLLLHLLPFASALMQPPPQARTAPPPIQARLLPPPPVPAPASPELMLPEPPKPDKSKPSPPAEKPKKPSPTVNNWQQEVRKQLKKQDERGDFYPAEAIAQGLQGQVLIYLILDAGGQVAAARVEESSGHRLLDDAALRAVRALRSLPADAPRETLLPVNFRLR